MRIRRMRVAKMIELSPPIIKRLQKLADKDRRKLKPYMEKILEEYVEGRKIHKYVRKAAH